MLSEETKAICKQLTEAITARLDEVCGPVSVSPRVMRAMILASQQQMQLSFSNGKLVTIVEADDAPEITEAVDAACQTAVGIASTAETASAT